MTKEFITDYGTITVRTAMFEEEDGTGFYEGIELKDEEGTILEICGYRDIDEMSTNDVESLIEEN